jgi:hypothetical protein
MASTLNLLRLHGTPYRVECSMTIANSGEDTVSLLSFDSSAKESVLVEQNHHHHHTSSLPKEFSALEQHTVYNALHHSLHCHARPRSCCAVVDGTL